MMSKPKKPTSDELAAQIASGQRELASLDGELDQAKARVTASAHDDSAYSEAAKTANMLHRDRDAKARRLGALTEAREDAIDRELDVEIERLRGESKAATDARAKLSVEYEREIKRIQSEYETGLKSWRDKLHLANAGEKNVGQRLRDAQERRRHRSERGSTAERRRELHERKQVAESMTSATDDRLADRGRRELAAVDAEIEQLATAQGG